MKTKELIAKLQAMDPSGELEVEIWVPDRGPFESEDQRDAAVGAGYYEAIGEELHRSELPTKLQLHFWYG